MRQDLIDRLREITPEEQELLKGRGEIRRERYTNRRDFVVDSRLLLEKGRLIEIRPHTRFAYFPKHRHNYVEMVYMCAGLTANLIVFHLPGVPLALYIVVALASGAVCGSFAGVLAKRLRPVVSASNTSDFEERGISAANHAPRN